MFDRAPSLRFTSGRALSVAGVLVLSGLPGVARAAPPQGIPPAWRTDDAGEAPETTKRSLPKRFSPRPWYLPRVAVGVGLNFPELLPLEMHLTFGKYVGLHMFYTPPLPVNIRVEMPADVLSSKNGIAVANPDFTIRARAVFGPQYGAELLGYPFGGSFFLAAGASYRKMELKGSARSGVLVCSVIEAQKEPPCPDPDARLTTDTKLQLDVDAVTSAVLTRASLGWFWHVGSFGYVTLAGGATKPNRINRNVKVTATVDSPGNDDTVSGALAEVKREKEADLQKKAIKEMRPVDEKVLPILGISAGVRF
jgi:hypothetical protein